MGGVTCGDGTFHRVDPRLRVLKATLGRSDSASSGMFHRVDPRLRVLKGTYGATPDPSPPVSSRRPEVEGTESECYLFSISYALFVSSRRPEVEGTESAH